MWDPQVKVKVNPFDYSVDLFAYEWNSDNWMDEMLGMFTTLMQLYCDFFLLYYIFFSILLKI
jgi:hypothetical protein